MGLFFKKFDDYDDDLLIEEPHYRRRGGGPNAFTPAQLTNLRIWIETNLSVTGLNDGDPISLATDLSGLGNNMVQAVLANQPLYRTGVLNGLPVCEFNHIDASDGHWMTAPYSPAAEATDNLTFAAVFHTVNPADGEIMLWAGDPNGNGFGPEDEISLSLGNASLGNRIVSSYGGVNQGPESDFAPFNDGVGFHVAIGTFDELTNDAATKTTIVSVDNVDAPPGTGTTTNNYGTYQGETWWGKPDAGGAISRVWNGQMAALVVCAAVLTAQEKTNLYNFWAAKYGL